MIGSKLQIGLINNLVVKILLAVLRKLNIIYDVCIWGYKRINIMVT